jgi:hypothetical protein
MEVAMIAGFSAASPLVIANPRDKVQNVSADSPL